MAVELNELLAWRAATGDAARMLDELQPNILKPHVRHHLSVLLLQFEDPAEATAFLSDVATLMKSARTQLEETDTHKAAQKRGGSHPGTPYVGVGLSAAGYTALGFADDQTPPDPAFKRGMRARVTRRALSDPPVSTWDAPYRDSIHALVMVGDATDRAVSDRRGEILALMPNSVTVVGEETGLAQRNSDDHGIEHFGYVDGRSQPIFLEEDYEQERASTDGTDVWDPRLPLERVIVPDPAADDPSIHFGSYLVFRKLEQNVKLFKEQEESLASALGLEGDDAERAGAMLVGRFEDGTPLTLQGGEGAHSPVMNNFTYTSDEHGMKCPLYAHIRKVNPRGPLAERAHLMARRGQTYGVRSDDINKDLPASSRPVDGVGLLFMAFNASIGEQFEYTQQRLANGAEAADAASGGVDPIIGQGPRESLTSTPGWGEGDPMTTDPVAQAVTMKGGEYFFMPSLAFLKSPDRT
jgi:Dyp-type peroxidase family